MNWRDILERAAWTAVQGAIAAVPVAQVTAAIGGSDVDALAQLALAGLGGGVAAALSFIKTVAQERLGMIETRSDMVLPGTPDHPPVEDEWA